METGQVPSLGEIADRLAIIEVIHTYSRGLDRADAEILLSTCWPDAEVDYGFFKGAAHPFLENMPNGLKRYGNTQHQISNTIIEISGNEARVESYVTAHHYLPVEDGDDTEMTYIGRYLDQMEKRDNVWKIKFRKIVMTWHQEVKVTADFVKNESLVPISRATHDPDDPLFAFLRGSNE